MIIAIVLSGIRLVHNVPYTGPRHVDIVGSALSVLGMGGIVLASWCGRRAVSPSAADADRPDRHGWPGLVAAAPQAPGPPMLLDPELFASPYFRLGSPAATPSRSPSAAP